MKTVTTLRHFRTARSSIRSLALWRPTASWGGWRALLSSGRVLLATVASSQHLIRPKCVIDSTAKSNTASHSVLLPRSFLSKPLNGISTFLLVAPGWRGSCRACFRFDLSGGRNSRRSHMSTGPSSVVPIEAAQRYFDIPPGGTRLARFMSGVFPVRPEWRSQLQAITHVDGTELGRSYRSRSTVFRHSSWWHPVGAVHVGRVSGST